MSKNLPANPLPEDIVDMAAKEVALQVCQHIEHMYPKATEPIAWESCKRSIQGSIRNDMRRIGRAAENGTVEAELAKMKSERAELNKLRKLNRSLKNEVNK